MFKLSLSLVLCFCLMFEGVEVQGLVIVQNCDSPRFMTQRVALRENLRSESSG